MAFARVEGAIGGDAGDLLIGRDLVEKFGQHPRGLSRTSGVRPLDVTDVAAGELRRPDPQCLLVDPDVDLAPYTALRAAMLAPSSGKQSPGLFADPPQSILLRLRP